MSATTMRAAVLAGDGRVQMQRVPVPQPAPDQVCVRLEGCGVCASNLPVWEGREWFDYPIAPGAPGHEGWGRIAAVGDAVDGWRVGERVALLSGHAYADFDVATPRDLARLPDALADEDVPGEPLGCAMNIFRRSDVHTGQTVAIVGTGFLGALLVQLCAAAGARVIALSRRPFARELASASGAAMTFATDDRHTAAGAVFEATGGRGCERVIEVAGLQSTLDLASDLVAEGGRLVIAGYHQDGLRQVNLQQWNWRGIDVINAHERDPQVVADGMRAGIAAMADGRLRPQPLLTHRVGIDGLADAFELMRARPDGFVKAVLTP